MWLGSCLILVYPSNPVICICGKVKADSSVLRKMKKDSRFSNLFQNINTKKLHSIVSSKSLNRMFENQSKRNTIFGNHSGNSSKICFVLCFIFVIKNTLNLF